MSVQAAASATRPRSTNSQPRPRMIRPLGVSMAYSTRVCEPDGVSRNRPRRKTAWTWPDEPGDIPAASNDHLARTACGDLDGAERTHPVASQQPGQLLRQVLGMTGDLGLADDRPRRGGILDVEPLGGLLALARRSRVTRIMNARPDSQATAPTVAIAMTIHFWVSRSMGVPFMGLVRLPGPALQPTARRASRAPASGRMAFRVTTCGRRPSMASLTASLITSAAAAGPRRWATSARIASGSPPTFAAASRPKAWSNRAISARRAASP